MRGGRRRGGVVSRERGGVASRERGVVASRERGVVASRERGVVASRERGVGKRSVPTRDLNRLNRHIRAQHDTSAHG